METVDFHDFLDRMRNPAAADLVRSIKSFIISFQSSSPDPDKDSKSVQEFMTNMEGTFRVHPLWTGATDEEIESAGEGLEKYLMTKLHNRAFASLPEDVERDQKISEKISLLQMFIKPEHLDIPPNFRNETSWLLAQKELQKINTYKAPRDKLVCILNCCRVINNLLLNVSLASNDHPPGADDFLPVLIYVTIKANPPQLHLNLMYIQRYRHHSRLVSEASYFYTNLVSAESFIENLEASSISMDRSEFEYAMQGAKEFINGTKRHQHSVEPVNFLDNTQSNQAASKVQKETLLPAESIGLASRAREHVDTQGSSSKHGSTAATTTSPKKPSLKGSVANLEAKGALAVLEANRTGRLAKDFPFLYANFGDLRVEDVESLLNEYKELVLRYYSLCKAVEDMAPLNTQVDDFSHRDESPGVTASNEDNERTKVAMQSETLTDLSESGLEQGKHMDKEFENTMEQKANETFTASPPRDLDILNGLTIHSAIDGAEGNDMVQSLSGNLNEATEMQQSEMTFEKNSDMTGQISTDNVKFLEKSISEHLLENEASVIDN